MAVDLSVFNNQKDLTGQLRLQQSFDLQKALSLQGLQSGQIDAASKKNIFATQVLSAAAAGGQDAYDKARGDLQNHYGIDTTGYAPDVGTATQQLQQARVAQSPLGSLLNVAGKIDGNNIAAGVATGAIPTDPNATIHAVMAAGAGGLMANRSGISMPAVTPNSQPIAGTNLPPPMAGGGFADMTIDPPLVGAVGAPQAMPMPTTPLPPIGDPSQTMQQPALPPQKPGETLVAYKTRIDNDPNVIAANERAKAAGKAAGDASDAAAKAPEATDQILQNLEAIKTMAPQLPQQGLFLDANQKAAMSQRAGTVSDSPIIGGALRRLGIGDDQATANNMNAFGTINEAQTINAIKSLAANGQIRMSQFLEKVVNRGFLVDPNASPSAKIQQANAIEAELKNSAINAQNVDARLNGGATQQYTSPLVANDPQGLQADFMAAKAGYTPAQLAEYKRRKAGNASN